jgi:hypothetical protein
MTVWGTSQDEPLCRCLLRDGRPPALAGRKQSRTDDDQGARDTTPRAGAGGGT